MNIVLGNLLIGIGQVLGMLIGAFNLLVLGRVIISWVNADPYNPIVRFLVNATEPPLRVIRKFMPKFNTSLDFTPLILLLLLYFVNAFIGATLIDFGVAMKMGKV